MSNNNQNNNKIWTRSLDDIMSESFGKYAKYIIQDRALPDIRDGLKPVQRRILYAMNELKIHYDKPYKKSARTVGEVIGKYHPHGDSSIYEAMVRMAQEWKNNIPLLDMQGNKGSIDGDGPAAMRYTECRLSKFGQYMMNNIQKDTVKFISNFDDSENEPSVLPSLLPNILINGATGIAAGYATNIPPFNFNEVMNAIIFRINNPNSQLADITKIIKGPDFPTGGIIQGREGIDEIFATGKGKFFVRAKIEEEAVRSSKKTQRLVIKEIPYDTNKANLVKSLDEIRINNELPGFKEVRDDSDKSGISIVLEFDTSKDIEVIKTFLYKKTQLQISYTANIVLIKDRKPVQVGIIEILDSFIAHINQIVVLAAQYDLNKALARKEILEGLIKAISDIDVLVELIKTSSSKDEAKTKIEKHFNVNERQSEAIVNLRLYVLTSYDTKKLKEEYEELLQFINEKEQLINSQEYRNKHLSSVLNDYIKELNCPRKSVLEDKVQELEIETTAIIEEIKGTCIVTRDNYVKFVHDNTIEQFDMTKTKIKDTDLPIDIFKLSTLDYLVCLTNKGKCITIPAYKIKNCRLREIGVHINEMVTIDPSEKTICAFAINKNSDINTEILVATKNSLIKRVAIKDFNLSKNAKSFSYINLKNDDEVANAQIIKPSTKEVVSITEQGFATKYSLDEIPVVGRTAAGVKNMSLKVRDLIATTIAIPDEESFIFITSNRGGKRMHLNDIPLTSRGKAGKRIFQQVESNPYIVNWASIIGGRSSVFLLTEMGTVEVKISDIPISETTSRMNSFSKVEGSILKASYLSLDKNVILTSETNNFNTLNQEEEKEKAKKAAEKPKQPEKVQREFVIDADDENAKPVAVVKEDLLDKEANQNHEDEVEIEAEQPKKQTTSKSKPNNKHIFEEQKIFNEVDEENEFDSSINENSLFDEKLLKSNQEEEIELEEKDMLETKENEIVEDNKEDESEQEVELSSENVDKENQNNDSDIDSDEDDDLEDDEDFDDDLDDDDDDLDDDEDFEDDEDDSDDDLDDDDEFDDEEESDDEEEIDSVEDEIKESSNDNNDESEKEDDKQKDSDINADKEKSNDESENEEDDDLEDDEDFEDDEDDSDDDDFDDDSDDDEDFEDDDDFEDDEDDSDDDESENEADEDDSDQEENLQQEQDKESESNDNNESSDDDDDELEEEYFNEDLEDEQFDKDLENDDDDDDLDDDEDFEDDEDDDEYEFVDEDEIEIKSDDQSNNQEESNKNDDNKSKESQKESDDNKLENKDQKEDKDSLFFDFEDIEEYEEFNDNDEEEKK